MKKQIANITSHLKHRAPALALCAAVFFTFVLYYLGFYDVSFIKRPAAWENNKALLYAALAGENKTQETEPPAQGNTVETQPSGDPGVPDKPDSDGAGSAQEIKTASALAAEGYYTTDKIFDEACRFALLETSFALPDKFSYSNKTYDKQTVQTDDDGTLPSAKTEQVTEARPAIELYMGYMIFDDKGSLYLIGHDGTPLCAYDEGRYIPAYTRDRDGRPLFYNTYNYTAEYPTSVNEAGEWLTRDTLRLTGKHYYYLAADGRTFAESDYNDAADNRGLYFDYPAYYGVTDSKFTRYYRETTRIQTALDGKTTLFPSLEWLFKLKNDNNFNPDAEETVYPYTNAYNFSDGYAAVRSIEEWKYTNDDKEEITVQGNELRVVNEDGRVMFGTRKNFVTPMGWTANEEYTDPVLRDISALGSYYFENGLMRIRLMAYDCYHFAEFDTIKVVSDEDFLIRPDGTRFYTPAGYNFISYSNGMILLEKDGKYGFMDYTGKWVIQPKLEEANPFLEGVASVKRFGKYGVLNTSGSTVIPFKYDYVSNISSGIIAAYSESSGWDIYTKMAQ